MKICSLTHQVLHLFSKQWTLSTLPSCLPFYKLSKNPSKTTSLHSTLFVGNYATSDGFVNGVAIYLKHHNI
jgi:hypothetical protein